MVNKGQCFLMCFLGTLCALIVWAIFSPFITPLTGKAYNAIVEYVDNSESQETSGGLSDIINNESNESSESKGDN